VNGAHDMGGVHGFGPVTPEPDEPVFHADWERRVFALTIALGASGEWNIDASRSAREDRPPAEYLSKSYYELWFAGLERLLAERGLVAEADEDTRAPARTLAAADVRATLGRGGPAAREAPRPARFNAGDRVRARNLHPSTHTRLPRYVRGRAGTIELVHGCHVFPDSNALGRGEDPQWLYTVRFSARELWGPDADPSASVSTDAFEPYLEPA
jgi:nitrile hydratase beta subunit